MGMEQTMTSTEYLSRASKTSNVALALSNFQMWLGWYPADYTGATEFAGDMIETLAEADEFEQCLKEGLVIIAAELMASK
jgi:hypothetical protein